MNNTETVWSVIKQAYLQQLYRRESNMTTQKQFYKFLEGVLDEQVRLIRPSQIMKANHEYIEAHLRLRDVNDDQEGQGQ